MYEGTFIPKHHANKIQYMEVARVNLLIRILGTVVP